MSSEEAGKCISNLVMDIHCWVSNYLALSLDVIIMPRMEVCQLVCRQHGRGLAKATRRRLLGWGHCWFLNCLAVKCSDIAHDARYLKLRPTILLVQPEAYTSKTCGRCGHLHHRLGSNQHFSCPQCHYEADRDHNGAFNMLIKAIRNPSP